MGRRSPGLAVALAPWTWHDDRLGVADRGLTTDGLRGAHCQELLSVVQIVGWSSRIPLITVLSLVMAISAAPWLSLPVKTAVGSLMARHVVALSADSHTAMRCWPVALS